MIQPRGALLTPDDPPPVRIENPAGPSPFLILGDHAGLAIPAQLQMLGLPDAELRRHIGWDIGVGDLGWCLSKAMDATFIHQSYSRLVVDCNRAPDHAGAILELSDGTEIPGNLGLDARAINQRIAEIHTPYHLAIRDELEGRRAAGRPTVLIALHSFTDRMAEVARPWHIGILHDGGDARFAKRLLAGLREIEGLEVGDNQPYRLDSKDYTVPLHAYQSLLPYAEIEVRQDLLAADEGIAFWCDLLRATLGAALPSG
jgi:predicted N-formylglutamate amidohydrolase